MVGGDAPAPSPDPNSYFASVHNLYPDAVFTGGTRTPQRNAQVGGVPDSMHLSGQALDFTVPGVPSQQVFANLKAHGLPMTESLDEGNHLHVGWAPKGGQAKPATDPYGAYTIVQPNSDPYSNFTIVSGGATSGAHSNIPARSAGQSFDIGSRAVIQQGMAGLGDTFAGPINSTVNFLGVLASGKFHNLQ